MTVIENQSLLDIAIQEDGSVLSVFEWAIQNGLSITGDLVPGEQLIPPISKFKNEGVANYYRGKNLMIAIALSNLDSNTPIIGIGTMIIETNFTIAKNG